jgi:hypothetical protein
MGNHTNIAMERRYVFPEPGERLSTLAERLFPGDATAGQRLLSWNLHLVTRRSLTPEAQPSKDPELLPTDVVFVEAPRA